MEYAPPGWCHGLPTLRGLRLCLREPVADDAPSLLREICAPEVCKFIPPPPTTIEGVVRTIELGREWRRLARGFSFAIQPEGKSEAAGLLQFLGSRDDAARVSTEMPWEWGFGIGSRYWGTGLFGEAATLALNFAFDTVQLQEIEAWVLQENQRANGALGKLGGEPVLKPDARSPDGRVGHFVKWTIRRPA